MRQPSAHRVLAAGEEPDWLDSAVLASHALSVFRIEGDAFRTPLDDEDDALAPKPT